MEHGKEKHLLSEIVKAIEDAGYDPKTQIEGYLVTGLDQYITRNGNARELIKQLSLETLNEYLK